MSGTCTRPRCRRRARGSSAWVRSSGGTAVRSELRRALLNARKDQRVRLGSFAALVGWLFAATLPAYGQPATTHRIGYISPEPEISGRATFDAFREGLRILGYVEGRNVSIDARWGNGSDQRLEQQAA